MLIMKHLHMYRAKQGFGFWLIFRNVAWFGLKSVFAVPTIRTYIVVKNQIRVQNK